MVFFSGGFAINKFDKRARVSVICVCVCILFGGKVSGKGEMQHGNIGLFLLYII